MRRYSLASLMFSWRSISALGVASPFCRPGVRLGLWRRLVHLGRPILKGFLGRRTIGFPSRVVIGLARWFSDGVRDGKRTAALENQKTPSHALALERSRAACSSAIARGEPVSQKI